MELYLSGYRENAKNTIYPHTAEIRTAEDLRKAVQFDHMACKMKDSYRDKANFLSCDCLMFDIDNTHSDDPDAWITEDDIAETFPVPYYLVRSRNYMKEKRKVSSKGEVTISEPREKWHIYFPIVSRPPIKAAAFVEGIITDIFALFPFFDSSAMDTARFFFGVENPHVTENVADALDIVEYIYDVKKKEDLRKEQREALEKYAQNVKRGRYVRNKSTENTINVISNYLRVPNPLEGANRSEWGKAADTPDRNSPAFSSTGEVPEWILYADQTKQEEWLQTWAKNNNIPLGRRYVFKRPGDPHVIAYCVPCLWENEHTMKGSDNEAIIQIASDGSLGFICRHSHGHALNWKQYRAKAEALARSMQPERTPPTAAEASPQEQAGKDQGGSDIAKFLKKVQTTAYKPHATRVRFFDYLLDGGMVNQTVLLIMAAPAAGKTTLCQQIAESLAWTQTPVIYLNLEMTREQMIAKSISARASKWQKCEISVSNVLQGYAWNEALKKVIEATASQYETHIHPYLKYNPDGVGTDIRKLLAYLKEQGEKARQENRQAPVVVLDYLHLITNCEGLDNAEMIKQAMQGIKDYCKYYDTFAIVISATNRASNGSGRITMESGRDTSNIEYTADVQMALNYWEVDQGEVSPQNTEEMSELLNSPCRRMILRVLKSRFSRPGLHANMYFHPATNTFYGESDFMPNFIPLEDVKPFKKKKKEVETPKAGKRRGEA